MKTITNLALLSFISILFFSATITNAQTTQVEIGNAEAFAGQPISRFFRYHASEFIYLQSEIDVQGDIKSIAFNKASGSNTQPILAVTIYMKHTSDNTKTTGTTNTVGYQLVYDGTFPNTAATGWMSVNLDTPFAYNNTDNLEILVIKGDQAPLTSAQFPRWFNTSSGAANRIRSYNDDSNPWSSTRTMSALNGLPDVRFEIEPTTACVPTFSEITEEACFSFELNGQVYQNTGQFEQVITNAAGCDSTITLNLTIKEVNNEVTFQNGVLTALQNNASYQWIDCANNNPIAGETSQTFSPAANGEYAVVINYDGCEATSDCIPVTGLSTSEWHLNNDVVVYPNPTDGVVELLIAKSDEIALLNVLDYNGKIVKTKSDLIGQTLNLSDLESGLYIFTFLDQETQKLHAIKILKK
ncbi:MAG: T9SS type A sorting domain-containing protein, partial [Crocinitomicaceae bacterium]|nr:T9SS type A sorting domain-containing protein [Crocinitomicaceae bacterium]